jgi:hypothetical protein
MLLHDVQTGSGPHPAMYPVGMNALSMEIKWLIIQLLLVSWCRMYGALPPHFLLSIHLHGLGTVPILPFVCNVFKQNEINRILHCELKYFSAM